jgi:hypothetical protein
VIRAAMEEYEGELREAVALKARQWGQAWSQVVELAFTGEHDLAARDGRRVLAAARW